MKRVGIDVGSLYVGGVVLEGDAVRNVEYREHGGRIQEEVERLLGLPAYRGFDALGLTGELPGGEAGLIDNTLALIEGARFLLPGCRNVFAIGGQTFSLLFFEADGAYREHSINPPCAAGTGSFIEQQAERLGLSAAELAEKASAYAGKRPLIATRCAVFAKTDVVHAMQEGYSLEAVCAGLCDGIARTVLDSLVKGRPIAAPAGFVGGVSLNRAVAAGMERLLGVEVRVPEHAQVAGAVGAALLGTLPAYHAELAGRSARTRRIREPLRLSLSDYPDFADYAIEARDGVEIFLPRERPGGAGEAYLGIDIGSTSTKAVLISPERELLGGFYTVTAGRPIAAVQKLIRSIDEVLGRGSLRLRGAATTGSGRMIIKELFDAELAVNEITAHARAAVFLHPKADTILEIGGQDSKFTLLRDGEVYFSAMNYVCAAGTGSFIEEQARRLGVGLEEFSALAAEARAPFTSDRCTVYMERDLNALLAEGWSKSALAAAVLNSVRDNYLSKVVSRAALGDFIVFQGATGRNKALVASFEQLLQKPIHVSPCCHLTGALGAALLCLEAGTDGADSRFIWQPQALAVSEEICRLCANHCLLTVVEKDGRKAGWGMKCGREYGQRRPKGRRDAECSAPERRFARLMAALARGGVAAAEGKRRTWTIGIPLALYNLSYAPLWHGFLTRLGFSVGLSESRRQSLEQGKGLVNSDFCTPMVLAHGYVRQMLDRGFDFLFCPAVVNEKDAEHDGTVLFRKKTRDAYFCYYSQYLPTVVSRLTAVDVEPKLIAPLIYFSSMSLEQMAAEIHRELNRKVPVQIGLEETVEALRAAYASFTAQRRRRAKTLQRELGRRGSEQPNILLLGRPYVLFDPALNMGLPVRLEQEGARLFWQEELDLEGFQPGYAGRYYERMHWHYGRQIVKAAEYCARAPNLFAVYLTSFRCSPDSFLISYVKDIMAHYGKPFLVLQLDEHGSDVGYATRIEAGMQSFRNQLRANKTPMSPEPRRTRDDALEAEDTVLVPCVDPLSSALWRACFRKAGYDARMLVPDERSLSTGYRYVSGGECMPLVSLIGGVIEKVREESLDPRRTFFYIPTLCMACNFPCFPVLSDLAFETAGLSGLKIGLINSMAPGEILPPSLSIRILESNILAGVLYKLFHRILPYETSPGETEALFLRCKEEACAAILEGRDLRGLLAEQVGRFRRIERDESAGRKPRIALLGDLYVKFNDLVNQKIQDLVRRLGGELIVPSLTEYPFHFYDSDVRLHGDDPRHFRLLQTIEKRYERLAGDLLEGQEEPDFAEYIRLMEEYGVRHYLTGETSINVGRALYYLKKGLVEAILHLNPMFCCPGVVTASIFRKLQEDFGVPIIDIFYDGTGNPNRILIPHLHYLKEARRSLRRG
jgi:predicted CoA-substrate-specific enzyme activase